MIRKPANRIGLLLSSFGVSLMLLGPAYAEPGRIDWADVARFGTPETDELVLEVLYGGSLTDAIAVAQALPRRKDPALAGIVGKLLQHGGTAGSTGAIGTEDRRTELLLRIMLDAAGALPDGARERFFEANGRTVTTLFEHLARFEAPMLRATVWRTAAAAPPEMRRELLGDARAAAFELSRRIEEARRAGGPETRLHPELVAEASAFMTYAAVVADPTMRALVEEIRMSARNRTVVEQAREVLEP
ncbi:MAG: hypothetical protein ACLFM6_00630 [Spirochaetaceae bacterium]